ncbi:beta-1,4-mannosyltransferase [Pholiota conissans]|uniref:Chitobiosyldiphosphodolichol beta-mannosyltransferase n=1 Tax=Pholiota conissans TaxID=109636 RepID=A0A9P6CTR1_9AGAR|nr:beta-1,4-mannosyltransferase [Pholiota conissans]
MYHAQSFAENGFVTDLIGYGGSEPIPSLERLPVQIRHIPELPKIMRTLPFLILAPIKIVHQIVYILLWILVWIDVPPEFILVQNPPSIPTLALVQLVGRIRGSKIIIDWHNLGYSILALKLGKSHVLVRIAKSFEATFGYSAYAHLFVTRAMRNFLVKEWDLQGHKVVLHDRPPRHFHRSSIQEMHELFFKLQPTFALDTTLTKFLPETDIPYTTILTQIGTTRTKSSDPFIARSPDYTRLEPPTLRPDRPAVLVSSTSWTPDENFGILLDALGLYDRRAEDLAHKVGPELPPKKLPKLLVIVTGKGPLREKYMSEVKQLQMSWKWVRCISLWLEAVDYPIMLGSANLGVCLHSSSSALDLPMKVVDMFGCGLPVCALDFSCLNELVKNGKNGLIFETDSQLALQLEELFLSFPNAPYLQSMANNLASLPKPPPTPPPHRVKQQSPAHSDDEDMWCSWEENWARVMRPLILKDVSL